MNGNRFIILLTALALVASAGCASLPSHRRAEQEAACNANLRVLNGSAVCRGIDANLAQRLDWSSSVEVLKHMRLPPKIKICPSGGQYQFRYNPGGGALGGGVITATCSVHGNLIDAQPTPAGDVPKAAPEK